MKWTLPLLTLFLFGCTPALEYKQASSSEIRKEELVQKRMAAEVKKERTKRLYKVANSLKKASITYCKALGIQNDSCHYPVEMVDDQAVNAFADGKKVYIPVGMIRFAENDDELALVVGHELAHNTLNHVGKQVGNRAIGTVFDLLILATTGVDTFGTFGDAGSQAYSQSFESEADYLGMYIVASSGYDIDKAALFWRKMAIEHPGAIAKRYDSTHPSSPERFTALSATLKEISEQQEQGLTLMPKIKGQDESTVPSKNVVPVQLNQTKEKEEKIIVGKYSYQVASIANEAGCTNENGIIPDITMFKSVPGEEYYRALCKNMPPIEYLCAYQQCSRVEETSH